MKKVILFAAVAATIALASCGKKAEAPAADSTKVDSTAAPVDTTATPADTTSADTAAKK